MTIKDGMVTLAKELIGIPSVSDNLTETARIIAKIESLFKGDKRFFIKKEVSDGISSILVSNADTTAFDVLMLGHADVVHAKAEDFKPRIVGDRLYGRGAFDMKGMVAVMLTVMKTLPETSEKIGVLIVTDEEVGGKKGAKYWVEEKGIKAKTVLDLDGSGIDTIIEKAKAALFIKLTAKGKGAHGAYPWRGIDANEELIRAITAIRKHFPYISKENPVKSEWVPTLHVGTISGGKTINSIAETAEATLDFRLTEKIPAAKVKEIVRKACSKYVKAEILSEGSGTALQKDSSIAKAYIKCVEKTIKRKVKLVSANGATDGRYFNKQKSVIITHQASGANLHQDGEWVSIKSLGQMYDIVKGFVLLP